MTKQQALGLGQHLAKDHQRDSSISVVLLSKVFIITADRQVRDSLASHLRGCARISLMMCDLGLARATRKICRLM
jgi:hypothetical protein